MVAMIRTAARTTTSAAGTGKTPRAAPGGGRSTTTRSTDPDGAGIPTNMLGEAK
ncbi:MAG TPA: hypothetical protein VFZ53_03310 [Polyangiaceae bacterium]